MHNIYIPEDISSILGMEAGKLRESFLTIYYHSIYHSLEIVGIWLRCYVREVGIGGSSQRDYPIETTFGRRRGTSVGAGGGIFQERSMTSYM